jgi:hypothetical protein
MLKKLSFAIVSVAFADFGGYDFSDVDSMSFFVYADYAGDISVASFEAVPEPGTMAAIGLGVAALLRRRKRA